MSYPVELLWTSLRLFHCYRQQVEGHLQSVRGKFSAPVLRLSRRGEAAGLRSCLSSPPAEQGCPLHCPKPHSLPPEHALLPSLTPVTSLECLHSLACHETTSWGFPEQFCRSLSPTPHAPPHYMPAGLAPRSLSSPRTRVCGAPVGNRLGSV